MRKQAMRLVAIGILAVAAVIALGQLQDPAYAARNCKAKCRGDLFCIANCR